jgi:hypothetical protein
VLLYKCAYLGKKEGGIEEKRSNTNVGGKSDLGKFDTSYFLGKVRIAYLNYFT